MQRIFDRVDAAAGGVLMVRERNPDGSWHRRCIDPGADVTGEPEAVRALATAAWTDAVLAAWAARGGG